MRATSRVGTSTDYLYECVERHILAVLRVVVSFRSSTLGACERPAIGQAYRSGFNHKQREDGAMAIDIFERHESVVRSYCRAFPVEFSSAKGSYIESLDGGRYLDFFSGAGALNFGHNPDFIKGHLISYLESDGILHALDMYTVAKARFIDALQSKILAPRRLDYRVQFTGPTGTNAVEAALKIARKAKQRRNIFAFHGGFHGMTLGSLACTGNHYNRRGAATALPDVTFMPYPSYGKLGGIDTIAYIDAVLDDPSSGVDKPAAVLLETVQAEGGVIVAPAEWLVQLRSLCDKHDILMIVDDIQVGCGRTGSFFSFERANISPDIVTLSKSISGCGFPMAVVLLSPELDQWLPGEHNGTFRGNQLAFVSSSIMMEHWSELGIETEVARKARIVESFMSDLIGELRVPIALRGIGLIWGLDFTGIGEPDLVEAVLKRSFANGLIVENCGRNGQVLKILPPLVIRDEELVKGLEIIGAAIRDELDAMRLAGISLSNECREAKGMAIGL